MATKTNIELGDQTKQLYEWAEELLLSDDVTQFLKFCKDEGTEATETVSYTKFLTLKEEFESWIIVLNDKGWQGIPYQLFTKNSELHKFYKMW